MDKSAFSKTKNSPNLNLFLIIKLINVDKKCICLPHK